jgi:hypothetical protein
MVISKLFVWILSAKKFVYISAKTIFWQMSVFEEKFNIENDDKKLEGFSM